MLRGLRILIFVLVYSYVAKGQTGSYPPGTGSGVSTISCVGAPGNTTGAYKQACQTSAGAWWSCNNSAGCALTADWVALAGSGTGFANPMSTTDQVIGSGSSGIGAANALSLVNCTANGGVYRYSTSTHLFTCYTLASADIPNNAANTTGNAATATACSGSIAVGNVFQAGASNSCTESSLAISAIATLTGTQTLTNKTIDGVTPATMAFVDPTSSVQTQLNAKQASLTTGSQDSVFNGTLGLTSLPTCVASGGVYRYSTSTHLFTCYTLASADIPNNAANTSGNAATATALASLPTLCSTGNAPTGILANGNATGCAAIGGGGSSLFTSYQFGSQTALTGSGLYLQTTYPSIFTTTQTGAGTSGSPYIDAITLTNQAQNSFFAGPSTGGAGAVTFRAIAVADVPTLNQNTTGLAGTATALAANGTNCNAGNFPLGVDASGNSETCTKSVQQFFGTAAPGSVSGNLPGDLFSDTTNHNSYWCNAASGTAAPACTSVTTGGWTLLNTTGGSANSVFTGSTATNPSFSATPTFSLADVSVKSPVRVEPGAMTANVTSVTFTNLTAGAKFSIAWTQDATGGRTVSYGASASNTCTVDPTASATTTQEFEIGANGTTVNGTGCTSTVADTSGPEIAKPGTPASGTGVCWWDSTNHIRSCMDNGSSTVGNVVIPSTLASHNFATGISAVGVIGGAQPAFTDISGSATNSQLPGTGSTTVNGQTCTLGSSCTIPLSAVNPQTATYQVLATDFSNYKTITIASGTFTITLVASGSQPAAGQYIQIINYGSGVVTIARSGQNINGGTSLTLNAGSATAPSSAYIVSDGTNYFSSVNNPGGTNATTINGAAVPASAAPVCSNSSSQIVNCTVSGSGTTVILQTSPSIATPTITGTFASIDSILTVGLGVPIIGWQSPLSNSSATSAVTLVTSAAAGDYEIHFNLDLHTACTTGSEQLSLSFGWTGNSSRTLQTGNVSLGVAQTTSSFISGVQPIHVASGNITYTPVLTGSCATGTATWDGDIYVTRAN